jgi:hypothetical protein
MATANPEAAILLIALKEAIRQAILVLASIPRSDSRYLALGSAWSGENDDPTLGYGYAETVIRIQPSAKEISQAEIVSDWLSWLGAQGPGHLPRLRRWARGMALWEMADIEKCSERTISNRIDRSISLILLKFGGLAPEIEKIEEGRRRQEYPLAFASDEPFDLEAEGLRAGRVYIGGVGWMRRRRDEGRWKRHRTAVDQGIERVNAN